MGHALDHTLMDALTRRRRMQGYEVLWLPGMDHAGIATQNVVERELAKHEGKSRHDLGRDAFVQRVWEWKASSGGTILDQMRRLGDGVDWSRERFTMDEGLSRAVLSIFKRLYEDGLIYRAERIINWCPRCLTALSDIEVEHGEDEGELVSALREEGRIVAERRPYLHSVGHCQRCATTVEPRLSLQWFVRVDTLAKAAGDAVRDGRVRIQPKELEPRYFAWVDDMHDWC